MTLLYRALTFITYPLLVVLIFLRVFFKKEDPKRYKEKILPIYYKIINRDKKKLIWFHAASVGEYISIKPIIKNLNKNSKNLDFLITTITLSSANLIKEELKEFSNIHHRFLPLDVEFLLKRFLKFWKPNLIFLVDSEIWPNLILLANKNKIPLALLNARLSRNSYERWKLFPATAKKIFSIFKLCLTANKETKNFLKKLNAKNVKYNGNIKLFNKIEEKKILNKNKNILLKKRFWIAASTHAGEESFCLKTHNKLKKKYNNIITIIAPRHIERAQSIKALSESFNLKTQILNKNDRISTNKEIIIINSFGVLQNFFKYAKSVFIGKSLVKKLKNNGGQNPIDAAMLNCKVYHGPYVQNFKDIYKILEKSNISKQIKKFEDLSKYLSIDLKLPFKKNKNSLSKIKKVANKTLNSTMKDIKTFLINDI